MDDRDTHWSRTGRTLRAHFRCLRWPRHRSNMTAPAAIATNGKRRVRSLPLRVISRTPAASRRTMIRNPSCFTSCSHPGPEGGALSGEGRHGSMKPTLRRLRPIRKSGTSRAAGPSRLRTAASFAQ